MIRPPAALWAGAVLLLGIPSAAAPQADDTAERGIPGDAVARWRPYSREASQRFAVPLDWIERVMPSRGSVRVPSRLSCRCPERIIRLFSGVRSSCEASAVK